MKPHRMPAIFSCPCLCNFFSFSHTERQTYAKPLDSKIIIICKTHLPFDGLLRSELHVCAPEIYLIFLSHQLYTVRLTLHELTKNNSLIIRRQQGNKD